MKLSFLYEASNYPYFVLRELKNEREKMDYSESYSSIVQSILKRTPQVFNNIAGE